MVDSQTTRAGAQDAADIAVVGLAVMGRNLILNMSDHGIGVCAFNRTTSKVDEFLAGEAKGRSIVGAHSMAEMVAKLKRPRRVMLMVQNGPAVDECIAQLEPLLEPGDIIIDGGNSHFPETTRRTKALQEKGLLYIGTGVSGGEEGARHGPAIMPGGSPEAWPHVKTIFQAIAAKAADGVPCCDWIGPEGAGHFVKMVHNGIEYGDMQLICEAYQLLRDGLKMPAAQMAEVFSEWNKGPLSSYLIEITAGILAHTDSDGAPLVDKILDKAGQKGTGKWTVCAALDSGVPLTLISEAVFARCLSAQKSARVAAAKVLPGSSASFGGETRDFVAKLHDALLAAKICSYAQGFMLMRAAAQEFGWQLNYGGVATIWRGGCIIRSVFLSKIKEAFAQDADLPNLLLDEHFRQVVAGCLPSWRAVVITATDLGLPIPCFASALSFYDGYRSANSPANLLQAQRDYFGAHTYQRIDDPSGKPHHTNWTGTGGDVTAGTYTV